MAGDQRVRSHGLFQRPVGGRHRLPCVNPYLDAIRSGRAARVALQTLNQISRKRVWEPLNHRYGLPTVPQMSGGRAVFADPSAFLSALFPTADVPSLLAEHDEVQTKLTQRRARADLVYGESFDVGQGTSLCLYAMTRILKPAHVLETGVADGVSSFVFLAAMDRNGTGTLHSTDIRPNAGALVNGRDHWDLFLVDRRTPARSLAKYVRSLPPLDLFVHDSLHLRAWQLLELRLAYTHLRSGGVLASDDVDSSFAYGDFCQEASLEPSFLFDQTKFFGAARKI